MTAVIFDLDGTLIDSAPDIQFAVNAMLADAGHSPLDLKTVTSFIGNGVPTLVQRVMDHLSIQSEHHTDRMAAMMHHYTASKNTHKILPRGQTPFARPEIPRNQARHLHQQTLCARL